MLCFVCCFCILVFLFFSSEESWAVQVMPASAALSSASKVCLHHYSGLMPFVLMYWLLHAFLLLPAFHEMPDRTPKAWSTAHTVPLKCAAYELFSLLKKKKYPYGRDAGVHWCTVCLMWINLTFTSSARVWMSLSSVIWNVFRSTLSARSFITFAFRNLLQWLPMKERLW